MQKKKKKKNEKNWKHIEQRANNAPLNGCEDYEEIRTAKRNSTQTKTEMAYKRNYRFM